MMNKQMNMPALQRIMREFERQNERMEMTSDMMGDAIDDAFEVSSRATKNGGGVLIPRGHCHQHTRAF